MFPLRLLMLTNRGRKNTAAVAKLRDALRTSLLYPPLNRLHLSSPYSSSHKPNVESTSKPNNRPSSSFFLSSKDVKAAFNSTLDVFLKPKDTWKMIKETATHYWVGTKLLWNEIKLTRQILRKVLAGKSMTRRERIQLVRTSTDLFRLVPFSIFVIVPFMEFLLPFALKLFPNMLPSTFQDSLKKEESLKQELQMRLAVANFMQEALEEMARKKSSADAKEVIEFIERARLGEPIPNESVLQIARLFKDELTLSNISRPQLVSMCQYMQLPPYGADSFLRFQLRNKLRMIKDDDKRILWEGISSLDDAELREACSDRGMRSMDVPHDLLKTQLKEWLDLTKQQVPTSLLIMSRAFMLTASDPRSHHLQGIESTPQQVLQSMAALDSDIINEVVLNSASKSEVNTPDMRRRLLESIQFQKDMIEEERQEQEDATASASAAAAAKTSSSKATVAVNGSEQSAVIDTAAAAIVGAVDSSSDAAATAHEKEPTKSFSAISAPIPADTDMTPVGGVSVDGKAREKQELTINELIALGDLARGSALKREISELAVLEAYLESLPDTAGREAILSLKKKSKKINKEIGVSAEGVLSSNAETSIEPQSKSSEGRSLSDDGDSKLVDADTVDDAQDDEVVSEPVVEDRNVARMKSAISLMVNKLKVKINMTEKVLGDKLKLLDKDGDGEITVDEIKGVIEKVIKKGSNKEENIEQLFLLLDSDKDGKVSVVELLQYIHKKRESLEVEAVQAHIQSAQSGGSGSNNSSL
jgi:LETM1 and EF-hand domain-containing protein 1